MLDYYFEQYAIVAVITGIARSAGNTVECDKGVFDKIAVYE
jgi:hypothetical protein